MFVNDEADMKYVSGTYLSDLISRWRTDQTKELA